jgi:hypothetical protein
VLALEQVGVDNADIATGEYVRAVNGATPDEAGNVAIVLVDAANKLNTARTITLAGGATGSASFDGSQNVTLEIVVKDNSHKHTISYVDELQSSLDNKLSLTGGTMTEGIKTDMDEFSISAVDDKRTVRISGGKGWEDGASFVARGKDHKYPGEFICKAEDGENEFVLLGKPIGTLTWGGINIVRSINNITADKNGDVYLQHLKLIDSSYSFDTECKVLSISDQAGASFIMQSGTVKAVDATAGAAVTFDIPFSDTDYVVVCQQIKATSAGNDVVVKNKSTTGFEIDTSTTVDVM